MPFASTPSHREARHAAGPRRYLRGSSKALLAEHLNQLRLHRARDIGYRIVGGVGALNIRHDGRIRFFVFRAVWRDHHEAADPEEPKRYGIVEFGDLAF